MQKKLTITVDEKVYAGLHAVIGRRRISQFIESLVRPHVTNQAIDAAYRQMAQDEAREAEALEWAEATIGDVSNPASFHHFIHQCCQRVILQRLVALQLAVQVAGEDCVGDWQRGIEK